MDFWTRVEINVRSKLMGEDWRIHAVNPARLLSFRAKGLTVKEIQEKVNDNFDSGSFPVKLRYDDSNGNPVYALTRTGLLDEKAVCTGQVSQKGKRFLVFKEPG